MPLRRNNSPPVHTDWQPKPRRLRRAALWAARTSTNEATPTLANCSMYCIGQTNLMNHSFLCVFIFMCRFIEHLSLLRYCVWFAGPQLL